MGHAPWLDADLAEAKELGDVGDTGTSPGGEPEKGRRGREHAVPPAETVAPDRVREEVLGARGEKQCCSRILAERGLDEERPTRPAGTFTNDFGALSNTVAPHLRLYSGTVWTCIERPVAPHGRCSGTVFPGR